MGGGANQQITAGIGMGQNAVTQGGITGVRHNRIGYVSHMNNTPGLFGDMFRQKAQAAFSDNTNVHPAFGVLPKIQRNRALVQSVYRQTQGYMLIGDRVQETLSDPLHRQPMLVLQNFRNGSSISGRSRGNMRAAAPQQVTWKNAYYRQQKPPYRTPIGPFTHSQMPDQSILQRVNYWIRGGNTNNG